MRRIALACTFALGLVIVGTSAVAGDGDLDPTFANGGAAFADWATTVSRDVQVAVDSTGNVFVGATTRNPAGNRMFAVAKLRPDGSLHNGFGYQGLRTVDFDLVINGWDQLRGAYPLAGDQLMLVGVAQIPGNADAPAMARLTAAGNADETFGAGGKRVITNSPWAIEDLEFEVAARQRDGKFVFGGWCKDCPWSRGALVLRVNANGTPDPGFGTNGWASFAVPALTSLEAITIDSSGRIVLAGFDGDLAVGPHATVVARFLPNGSADTSFGIGTGYVRLTNVPNPPPNGGWLGRAIAADPDGSLLLALMMDEDMDSTRAGIVRVRENGTLDNTFGTGGLRSLDLEGGVFINALTVRSDRRIMATGSINHNGIQDVLVSRLRANGSLDPAFDGNGVARYSVDPQGGSGHAMTSHAGRPVIAGYARRNDSWDGFALRLQSDLIFADGIE